MDEGKAKAERHRRVLEQWDTRASRSRRGRERAESLANAPDPSHSSLSAAPDPCRAADAPSRSHSEGSSRRLII